MNRSIPLAYAAGAATVLGLRAWRSSPADFARMSGSSVAAPDAAPWITDFLNAAYYRRSVLNHLRCMERTFRTGKSLY